MSEKEIKISFDDNKFMALLCGELNENLTLIENNLKIEIISLGNHIILRGENENILKAKSVLKSLYASINEGQNIEKTEISAMIKMLKGQKNSKLQMKNIITKKTKVKARSLVQNDYITSFEKNDLIFGVGPAGTGKTFLAVAQGVKMLESGNIDRIILSRPAVEAGENLGFLPGDLKEKVDPYLRPLYDALYYMMETSKVDNLIANGTIEIAPLAFMRGRTLSNALIILDEAQNSTRMQMKMFLTRMGDNSKMIVTGDTSQIDLPRGEKSGLLEAIDLLNEIKGIAISRFSEKDVVRHELVGRIVKAYQEKQ